MMIPHIILAAGSIRGKSAPNVPRPRAIEAIAMRLNHVNLTVPDVAQAKGFFETYFGLRCVAERGAATPSR